MAKATKLQQRIAKRAARAAGPAFVGQVMSSVVEDDAGGKHEVVFLPDKNNPELRDAGKPMHFYFLPQTNRLARHSEGDFVFGVQRFSGIMDPSKNIGEDGYSELAGGVMNFTATLAPPSRRCGKGVCGRQRPAAIDAEQTLLLGKKHPDCRRASPCGVAFEQHRFAQSELQEFRYRSGRRDYRQPRCVGL